MQRVDLWERQINRVHALIRDLRPVDQVSVMTFNEQVTEELSFDTWGKTSPDNRVALVKDTVDRLNPGWRRTNLGVALDAASGRLLDVVRDASSEHAAQIILFGDIQVGGALDSLRAISWPDDISLVIERADSGTLSNASITRLPSGTDDPSLRVVVRNSEDHEQANFRLRWLYGTDKVGISEKNSSQTEDVSDAVIHLHVPPGQSQIVSLEPPKNVTGLELEGDLESFDNCLYVAESKPILQRIIYVGDAESDEKASADEMVDAPSNLLFYLRQVSLDDRDRKISLESFIDLHNVSLNTEEVPLVVLAKAIGEQEVERLRRYAENGGHVLCVIHSTIERESIDSNIARLFGVDNVELTFVNEGSYHLLETINFDDQLFAPLVDTRYNDFSKIRFWSHTRVTTSHEDPWEVVAQFDDGSPAIVKKPLGKGQAWMLMAGWHPSDSQLALSTKFIPLLSGWCGKSPAWSERRASYDVGEPLTFEESEREIEAPDGRRFPLSKGPDSFVGTDRPGIYTINDADGSSRRVAVNLSPDELALEPLADERFEQLGIRLGKHQTTAGIAEETRQRQNQELESQQKLWRFGLLGVFAFMLAETWLSARTGN